MADDFEIAVEGQVERFSAGNLHHLESTVAAKRIKWFDRNPRGNRPTPRAAFEMMFFDYLGISEQEVPVQSESDTEIVWLSRNRCPTLAACKRLDLDTRIVCRAVYEKSTQALVSQLDPQLRFHRSYSEIRPHASHCRERIIRLDFEHWMGQAVEEAGRSLAEGNKGYGAVVVMEDRAVARAHDTAVTENDPSLHAEVNALRQAVRSTGDKDLCGAVLFSTCEPCPMCSSLAVWANVTTIVYGVSIEETARRGKSRILVGAREIVEKAPRMIEVIGDVLRSECGELYFK